MNSPAVRDGTLLLARVVFGVIFVAHGWQKFFIQGLDEVMNYFTGLGVPQPNFSAILAASAELVGGAMLIVGILAPVAGVVLALQMLAAIYFVHFDKGIYVENGGMELALALCAGAVIVAVMGAGKYSLDAALQGRFGR